MKYFAHSLFRMNLLGWLALVALLLGLYLPVSPSPIRGEHWLLLHHIVESASWIELIQSISTHSTPGIERPQFAAFFVPALAFWLFDFNLWGHTLMSWTLHLLTALAVKKLLAQVCVSKFNQFIAAVLFVGCFLSCETLHWTFFSYIQLNTLIVLTILRLFIKYLEEGTRSLFVYQAILIVVATFLYECSFILIPLEITILLIYRRERFAYSILAVITGLIALPTLIAFAGMPNQLDANHQLHWGILYRSLIFLKILLSHLIGIAEPLVIVKNTIFFESSIPIQSFFTWWVLSIGFLFMALTAKAIKLQVLSQQKYRIYMLTLSLTVIFYVLVMAFARVRPEEGSLEVAYFETQFRYYYLPIALSIALFVSIPVSTTFAKIVMVTLTVHSLYSNYTQIRTWQNTTQPYFAESRKALKFVEDTCENSPKATSTSFVKTYLFLSTLGGLPVEQLDYALFVYDNYATTVPAYYAYELCIDQKQIKRIGNRLSLKIKPEFSYRYD